MKIVIAGSTSINGKEAAWSAVILKEFEDSVLDFATKQKKTEQDLLPVQVTVDSANYFEPRPYRNEYDRGSDERGFMWTVRWPGQHARDVVQTILSESR